MFERNDVECTKWLKTINEKSKIELNAVDEVRPHTCRLAAYIRILANQHSNEVHHLKMSDFGVINLLIDDSTIPRPLHKIYGVLSALHEILPQNLSASFYRKINIVFCIRKTCSIYHILTKICRTAHM